jgi:predicted nucleotidyltransferase
VIGMIPEVQNNLSEIIKTCKQMQVKSLYLFGSGARENDYNNNSDLDFLFRFKVDETGNLLAPYDYFDFMFKLEEITGRKIDLVAEDRITNEYLLFKISKEKIKLYES